MILSLQLKANSCKNRDIDGVFPEICRRHYAALIPEELARQYGILFIARKKTYLLGEIGMSMGTIVRCWGAVDYEPDIVFFDKMYTISKKLSKDYEQWWTDRIKVVLSDTKKKESLFLSSRRISFELLNPEDYDQQVVVLGSKVREIMNDLNISGIKRIGLKLVVYADLELTFNELLEQIRIYCIPKNERLERIISPDISDIAMVLDYNLKNNIQANLRVGPMKPVQGIDRLKNEGEIKRFFSTKEESKDIVDFYSTIPESFMYFDLDVFSSKITTQSAWTEFVQEQKQYLLETFEGVKSLIMESK